MLLWSKWPPWLHFPGLGKGIWRVEVKNPLPPKKGRFLLPCLVLSLLSKVLIRNDYKVGKRAQWTKHMFVHGDRIQFLSTLESYFEHINTAPSYMDRNLENNNKKQWHFAEDKSVLSLKGQSLQHMVDVLNPLPASKAAAPTLIIMALL